MWRGRGGGGLVDGRVGEGGGAALVGGDGVAAGGGGDEEGPLAGEAAYGELWRGGVGEGDGFRGGLAGGTCPKSSTVWPGNDVAGEGEGRGADAEALDVAEAVESGGAVRGGGLGEESAGDVAVGEGRKVTLKLQEALGARAAQAGPLRRNWRGRAMLRARDLAVRLVMVN